MLFWISLWKVINWGDLIMTTVLMSIVFFIRPVIWRQKQSHMRRRSCNLSMTVLKNYVSI